MYWSIPIQNPRKEEKCEKHYDKSHNDANNFAYFLRKRLFRGFRSFYYTIYYLI